ncbi:MAG: SDR family oxidoreductase [Candidatus Rokubacteria bacterium]|nr:SDR family oxidoreductase [Candidatus Rokubacteria bacterium]
MDSPLALVTGGSGEIGRALAVQLARDGFQVVVGYHTRKEVAETVRETIEREGGRALVRGFDVSSQPGVDHAVRELVETAGPVQALVNAAAVTGFHALGDMPDDEWRRVIDTNLNGVYHCAKAVMRTWAGTRAAGRRIITVSSVAGEAGYAGASHYCAAETGVITFTKALARELAPSGATVNVVAPGLIEGGDGRVHGLPAGARARKIPMGRLGRPQDVAHAVSFLASARAGYITGQVLRVNGGLLL